MKKIKALLVDDSKIDLTTAKYYIEDNGLDVDIADNGFTALERMAEVMYDVLIVDLLMPQMGGFELIKRAKAMPEYKNIPIIILSSKNSMFDVSNSIKLGVTDYMIKPIEPQVLSSKLKQIVKNFEEKWQEIPVPGNSQTRASQLISKSHCELIGISEIGVTVKSTLQFEVGERVVLRSALLESFGLSELEITISSFVKLGNKYYFKAKFVEINKMARHEISKFITREKSYMHIN